MPNILVVDDEAMLREAYAMLLTASGHTVRTANDGWQALDAYNQQVPDLVLLDMLMPNLDGVGFLEALKALERPQTAKIIIFSNLSTSEKVDQALALGAERHITKAQMTPRQLLAEIDTLLNTKDTEQ